MTPIQFKILRDQVCTFWVDAESFRLASQKEAEENRNRANVLNWATIIFGAFTGTSGLSELLPSATETATAAFGSIPLGSGIITGAFGAITAVLVGVKQTFNWEEKGQKLWYGRNEFRDIQRELQRHISEIAMNPDDQADPTFLQRQQGRLANAQSMTVRDLEKYYDMARAELAKHFISQLELKTGENKQPEEDLQAEQEAPTEATEASNLQRIVRGQQA